MLWVLWIVLVMLALVAAALWLPTRVHIHFDRKTEDDEGAVSIRTLFGLVRIHRNLTHLDIGMTGVGPAVKVTHGRGGQNLSQASKASPSTAYNQIRIGMPEVWEFVKHLPDWLSLFKQIRPITRQLLKRTDIHKLACRIQVGTGDAVTTGMLCGSLWSLVSVAVSAFTARCRTSKTPELDIIGDFDNKQFHVLFDCIVQVPTGHAILAALRLARVRKRSQSKEDREWNTPFRD